MNKTIRKHLNLSRKTFDKLIDLSSYDLINTFNDSQRKSKLYKHHSNSTCVLVDCIDSFDKKHFNPKYDRIISYYFFADESLQSLHRHKDPAIIIFDSHQHSVELHYFYQSKLNKTAIYEKDGNNTSWKLTELTYNTIKHDLFCYIDNKLEKVLLFNKKGVITEYAFDSSNNILKRVKVENKNKTVEVFQYCNNCYNPSPSCAINYREVRHLEHSQLHNLKGSAVIKQWLDSQYKPHTFETNYYFNNMRIPDNIIKPNINPSMITKSDVLDAMLFDREYGEYCLERQKSILLAQTF